MKIKIDGQIREISYISAWKIYLMGWILTVALVNCVVLGIIIGILLQ